jgi:hypothetical protein
VASTEDKFEMNDVPLVLAALKKAHEAKKTSRITVDIHENGGVVSVQLETKEKLK